MATERDFIERWPSEQATAHEVRAWVGTYFTLPPLTDPVASVDQHLASILNRVTWTGARLREYPKPLEIRSQPDSHKTLGFSASHEQLIAWAMPNYVASKLMTAIHDAERYKRRRAHVS